MVMHYKLVNSGLKGTGTEKETSSSTNKEIFYNAKTCYDLSITKIASKFLIWISQETCADKPITGDDACTAVDFNYDHRCYFHKTEAQELNLQETAVEGSNVHYVKTACGEYKCFVPWILKLAFYSAHHICLRMISCGNHFRHQ